MPVGSTPQMLETPYVTRLIQTFLTPQSRIQREFGVLTNIETGGNGPNVRPIPSRSALVDVFDSTRELAPMTSKGSGPVTIKRQKIGQIPVTLCRVHFKMFMEDNEMTRVKLLGGQIGDLDANGKKYASKQMEYAAQRIRNTREFSMGMMLRNGLYFRPSGEEWLPTAESASPSVKIDFQVPAGQVVAVGGAMADNLTLGTVANIILAAAPWDNAATDIITDLLEIDQGSEEVSGRPFRHFWLNSATWGKVITNTSIRNTGGSVNTPFESWDQWSDTQGKRTGGTAFLRGHPHSVWHICNEFLTDPVTGSSVQMFPTGYIAAHPDVDSTWFEFLEGGELQRENKASEPVFKQGIAAWTEPQTQPSGYDLLSLDNFLPTPNVPSCLAFFRVY